MWTFKDRPTSGKVFTFEPYGIQTRDLVQFLDDLEKIGLEVEAAGVEPASESTCP